jgi:hypothetical protein
MSSRSVTLAGRAWCRVRIEGVVWLAGLWGGGIGELVKDHDAAEGGPVEVLVVGQDVLVEDGEQARVEVAHLLVRQVRQVRMSSRASVGRSGSCGRPQASPTSPTGWSRSRSRWSPSP